MPFHVYILENADGRFYVGQTRDLNRRLAEHNDPTRSGGKYAANRGPWKLVYQEEFQKRAGALRRERFIKSRKSAAWIRRYLLGR